MLVERKHVAAEFKADTTKREVTGYASVFGNVDRMGDIVMPGAFTATLAEDLPAGRIKVKRNHESVIGRPVHAEQDSTGLLTVSRISPTPLGDETLALIQDGVIDVMSIGYHAEQKSFTEQNGRRIRHLEAVRLGEWSLLDIAPANPLAVITGVKSLGDVSYVLMQMQDTLRALMTLSYTPAPVAQRLTTLIADLRAVAESTEDGPDDSEAAAALGKLLSVFSSGLKA